MAVHIALLRGVNVGGKLVAMAALRKLLEDVEASQARSLLNSGNLVFASAKRGPALEGLLEAEAERQLGLTTRFLVRSPQEWAAMIAANPFPEAATRDPAHLVAMVLKDAPTATAASALSTAIAGPEIATVIGRTAYIVYPEGIGRSKLTIGVIERKLGTTGTGRNWNTVLKLAALAAG
jgi:uncharacterized protein (DUF1697 family)